MGGQTSANIIGKTQFSHWSSSAFKKVGKLNVLCLMFSISGAIICFYALEFFYYLGRFTLKQLVIIFFVSF